MLLTSTTKKICLACLLTLGMTGALGMTGVLGMTGIAKADKWHGLYAGGLMNIDNLELDATGIDTLESLAHNADIDDFTGTLFAGYNISLGGLLVGVEGDFSYKGTDSGVKIVDGNDLISLNVQNKFSAGIRGRLGFTMNDFLLYGTAGVAYSNLSLDLNTTFGGTETTLNKTENVMGYSLGGGAEFMVLNSLILRAEYLYTDFSTLDFTIDSGSGSVDTTNHDLRLGVALKF